MSIFIDNIRVNIDKTKCSSDLICHLFTDSNIKELHKFAKDILKFKNKKWFDNKVDRQHYDISGEEAIIALKNGAIQKLFDFN